MIQDEAGLADALKKVNNGLEEIHDYITRTGSTNGRFQFPPFGYLRECEQYRAEYAFIRDYDKKSNIAYTRLMLDVLKCLNDRTTIGLQAMTMTYKIRIVLVMSIAETLSKLNFTSKEIKGNGYNPRVRLLVIRNIISKDLAHELTWAWRTRQYIHLDLIHGRELGRYSIDDVNRATAACEALRESLAARAQR